MLFLDNKRGHSNGLLNIPLDIWIIVGLIDCVVAVFLFLFFQYYRKKSWNPGK